MTFPTKPSPSESPPSGPSAVNHTVPPATTTPAGRIPAGRLTYCGFPGPVGLARSRRPTRLAKNSVNQIVVVSSKASATGSPPTAYDVYPVPSRSIRPMLAAPCWANQIRSSGPTTTPLGAEPAPTS
ncbi:MAG: hypothetical protein M5U14_13265 [Acidimicrobiia bacterium]|nr:hypothetical protein [Acidimicrobiia bacterium]